MSDYKTALGILAALLSLAAHVPYMLAILRGHNRPHIFTWAIWSLLTVIAAAAQMAGQAGPGAWSTWVTFAMCLAITALTLRHGDRHITRTDWLMFVGGLAAIPAWLLTDSPVWAVALICLIDLLAFGPTLRKSWARPFEENTTMYWVNIPRHALALAALSTVSFVTAAYPALLLALNAGMYVLLLIRRRHVQALPTSASGIN